MCLLTLHLKRWSSVSICPLQEEPRRGWLPAETATLPGAARLVTSASEHGLTCDQMKNLVREHCVDAGDTKDPPKTVACPVDQVYEDKLKKRETELSAVLCSQM
jgi:hypothetical protein